MFNFPGFMRKHARLFFKRAGVSILRTGAPTGASGKFHYIHAPTGATFDVRKIPKDIIVSDIDLDRVTEGDPGAHRRVITQAIDRDFDFAAISTKN